MKTKNILSTAFTAIFAILLGLSSASAQTTTTVVNGVTFQYNASGYTGNYSTSPYANQCFIDPALWVGAIQFGVAGSNYADLIITTPTPVYSLQFLLGSMDENGYVNPDFLRIQRLNSPTNFKDAFTSGGFLVDGCLGYNPAGREIRPLFGFGDGANGYVTITSKTPFTEARIQAYGAYMVISAVPSTVSYCSVGTTAPALSGTTISNGTNCVTETVNLNSLHTGTAPGTSSLVWFTNNTASGSAYATPTAAASGTYYAFYFDGTNGGCYSPASAAVTATTTTCATCGANAGIITIP